MQVLDVGAANPGHFHFDEPTVGRNLGDRIFADLQSVRS
jgi:hypothetical protein